MYLKPSAIYFDFYFKANAEEIWTYVNIFMYFFNITPAMPELTISGEKNFHLPCDILLNLHTVFWMDPEKVGLQKDLVVFIISSMAKDKGFYFFF